MFSPPNTAKMGNRCKTTLVEKENAGAKGESVRKQSLRFFYVLAEEDGKRYSFLFQSVFHNACVPGELQLKFRLGACPHLAKKPLELWGSEKEGKNVPLNSDLRL